MSGDEHRGDFRHRSQVRYSFLLKKRPVRKVRYTAMCIFLAVFYPEDGGDKFLRNVSDHTTYRTTSHSINLQTTSVLAPVYRQTDRQGNYIDWQMSGARVGTWANIQEHRDVTPYAVRAALVQRNYAESAVGSQCGQSIRSWVDSYVGRHVGRHTHMPRHKGGPVWGFLTMVSTLC
jgi:hypothetical protein